MARLGTMRQLVPQKCWQSANIEFILRFMYYSPKRAIASPEYISETKIDVTVSNLSGQAMANVIKAEETMIKEES